MNKKRVGQVGIFAFTCVLLVYMIYIDMANLFRYKSFKHEYDEKVTTYNEALQKNQQYREALEGMQTQDYWELQAKSRLGYVKPGEVMYRITQARSANETPL